MTERPARTSRPESREVIELKQLKLAQPELASAIDMQIALVEMQRRVQARVPLPWIQTDPEWLRTQYAAGRPVVRFGDIPLDWTDFRLTLRQTADILRRFEALERADYEQIVALGRDAHLLEPTVTRWYEATSGVDGADRARARPRTRRPGLDQVLVLALRPFLARCAEVLMQQRRSAGLDPRPLPVLRMGTRLRGDHAERRPAPDLRPLRRAVDVRAAHLPVLRERRPRAHHVVCDARRPLPRVRVRRLPPLPEGVRRAPRHARPVMVAVDTIATLPLDAAAMQRGYVG